MPMPLRYLLIQVRNQSDPIRSQEIDCFASAIGCEKTAIQTLDLLTERITTKTLSAVDAVLIGGSGDYSAAGDSEWLEQSLQDLQLLVKLQKPTFASCWGFQALARSLGGQCINDPAHAELGTIELELTTDGQEDLLFRELGSPFLAQAGHEDHVVALPPGAVLLASSRIVRNQAFKVANAPIYCTQFHPELDRASLLGRLEAYPQYVEKIAGTTILNFAKQCRETPETQSLLQRFAEFVTNRH